MDMASPNVLLKALPMVSQRRVKFNEGTYIMFESGSSIVWDHCDRLKTVPDDQHIIMSFHGAKMVGSIPDLKLHCSSDGNTWSELHDIYPGDVARELPNKSCCLVRVSFEDPTPDLDRVWVIHRYSLTAPVSVTAPVNDFNGGQISFVQTVKNEVTAVLDYAPVFKFSTDSTYQMTFKLNSSRLLSLPVETTCENAEIDNPVTSVSIDGETTLKLKLKNFNVYEMASGKDAVLEVKLALDKIYAKFVVIISSKGSGDPLPPKPISSSSIKHSSNSEEEDPDIEASIRVLPSIFAYSLSIIFSLFLSMLLH